MWIGIEWDENWFCSLGFEMDEIIVVIFVNWYFFFSFWFGLWCFFGVVGCDYLLGIRGIMYIVMYLLNYIVVVCLLRYVEGVMWLVIVLVSE